MAPLHRQRAGKQPEPCRSPIGPVPAARPLETFISYLVLSRCLEPAELLRVKREHWQIENGLHWGLHRGLDVALREDDARNRKDHGPANIAVLRRSARDVVARDKSRGSLAVKLKRAGWDDASWSSC